MSENYVIKCQFSQWYFCASCSAAHGWYHPDIGRARIYTKRRYALKRINDNDHHVAYPGNRILVVVPIKIEEIKS